MAKLDAKMREAMSRIAGLSDDEKRDLVNGLSISSTADQAREVRAILTEMNKASDPIFDHKLHSELWDNYTICANFIYNREVREMQENGELEEFYKVFNRGTDQLEQIFENIMSRQAKASPQEHQEEISRLYRLKGAHGAKVGTLPGNSETKKATVERYKAVALRIEAEVNKVKKAQRADIEERFSGKKTE